MRRMVLIYPKIISWREKRINHCIVQFGFVNTTLFTLLILSWQGITVSHAIKTWILNNSPGEVSLYVICQRDMAGSRQLFWIDYSGQRQRIRNLLLEKKVLCLPVCAVECPRRAIRSSGTRGLFTNKFLPAIQIRWKLRLAIIPLLAIRSQQSFAHATTA